MKILVIGHTYIASINRIKWQVFANKLNNIQVKVIIPKFWPASLFNINAGDYKKDNLNNCEFIALKTRLAGNEVLYSYKFLDLYKILKSYKPDIIYVEQGDNAFSYFQIILLAKILRLKSKFTFFTWVNWHHKWSIKYKLVWSFIEKFNLKNSSGAIVGNSVAKDILINKKFLKNIEVLPQLGVNERYFYPVCHPELAVPDEALREVWVSGSSQITIGFIGRLVSEKGIWDLLKVFLDLSKKHNNLKLIFVGSGKEKDNLINFIKKNNMQDNIEFIPSILHEQVGEILNKFDIFVLPSYDTPEWKEQFGHVLIEAMACNVPVLGSNAGNIPDVIKNAGLIFEQKNLSDLNNKLELLICNKHLRKELSEKGYNLFLKNYSYDYIAEKTYKFFQEIL
ncbi:MAG: Glycosyltransferase-like protein [candidate division TM6 bacterium GW2011_GWF2_28_16]|nr:MAG: Glycosyltransferase-like protein [candidate division TM6 bacterium GW2011_GWF2_28_16]